MPSVKDLLAMNVNAEHDMAPLEAYLRAVTSGNVAFSPEMYQHFGGDDILKQVQKYDPNAKWTDVEIGGGEGGSQGMGKRLDYDTGKLPKSARGTAGFNLNPANLHENLKDPNSQAYNDPIYGMVRNSGEFRDDDPGVVGTYGPLVMAAITMGAGALAAAPAMAGVAGGTSAVTGGAAGLAAENIAMGGATNFLSNVAAKAPQIVRSQSGGFNPVGLAGDIAGASGVSYAQYLKPLLSLVGSMNAPKPAAPKPAEDAQLQALLALAAQQGR